MKAGPSTGRGMLRAPGGNVGTLILEVLENEQQMERKNSKQVGAKVGAGTWSEKWEKKKKRKEEKSLKGC